MFNTFLGKTYSWGIGLGFFLLPAPHLGAWARGDRGDELRPQRERHIFHDDALRALQREGAEVRALGAGAEPPDGSATSECTLEPDVAWRERAVQGCEGVCRVGRWWKTVGRWKTFLQTHRICHDLQTHRIQVLLTHRIPQVLQTHRIPVTAASAPAELGGYLAAGSS